MLDIAIFTALGWERRAVTAALGAVEPVATRRWTRASGGVRYLVVQTGVGQERARVAAQDVPSVALFLCCGCAGALVDWLRPGDIVLASEIFPVDRECRAADPLPADATLARWAGRQGVRIHVAPMLSSETVLLSPGAKTHDERAGALVVEMEGAALAQEARTRGIPFIDLRVVLDVQGQKIPALDALDEASGEIRPGRAATALLPRPWVWPAVARIARQTRVAERALRTVAGALLAGTALIEVATPHAASAAVS
jgi:nucleoside phosphorylase